MKLNLVLFSGKNNLAVLAILATFALAFNAGAQSVEVNLKISPAGSFVAKTTKVTGKAKQAGGKVTASGIQVDLSSLDTGIKLRDDHMKNKYLEIEKFPKAELSLGEGEGGKGKGKLKVHGVEKEINGTYEVKGKTVEATFEISLSEYNISGIRYMGAGVKDKAQVKAIIPLE